jgi:hypothetical protein
MNEREQQWAEMSFAQRKETLGNMINMRPGPIASSASVGMER